MVDGGHMTDVMPIITYASEVSRETLRISSVVASLNEIRSKTAEIMNAYIKATRGEKFYTILGPEFGPDEGKMEIIVRDLYGLKIAGEYFRNHLAECIKFMGINNCLE